MKFNSLCAQILVVTITVESSIHKTIFLQAINQSSEISIRLKLLFNQFAITENEILIDLVENGDYTTSHGGSLPLETTSLRTLQYKINFQNINGIQTILQPFNF